jgi:deoxyadenosine/deoxycytidine kinase
MDGDLSDQPNRRLSNSYIIEIVGPAGAGKSSLAASMSQTSSQETFLNPPNFHDLAALPFFAANTLQTAPHLVKYLLTQKHSEETSTQLVSIVTLNGWHKQLNNRPTSCGEILLLDQGPVFLLTELFELNPDFCQCSHLRKWRARMYQHWAHTVDLVVWLDAPDPILMKRINDRGKQHIMKEHSQREVYHFLSMCRRALDRTLLKLSRINRSLRIIEFDTSQAMPLLITSQIFTCLGLIEDVL